MIVEYVGGELQIYDNAAHVLTNAPTYDWHLLNRPQLPEPVEHGRLEPRVRHGQRHRARPGRRRHGPPRRLHPAVALRPRRLHAPLGHAAEGRRRGDPGHRPHPQHGRHPVSASPRARTTTRSSPTTPSGSRSRTSPGTASSSPTTPTARASSTIDLDTIFAQAKPTSILVNDLPYPTATDGTAALKE